MRAPSAHARGRYGLLVMPVVVWVFAALGACKSHTKWPDAERLCDQDISSCAVRCNEGDTGFCDALAVMRTLEDRRYVEWRGSDYFGLDRAGPEELKALANIASYRCRVYKSQGACTAAETLKPLLAKAAAKPEPAEAKRARTALQEAERRARELAPRDEKISLKLFEASGLIKAKRYDLADVILSGVMSQLDAIEAEQAQVAAEKERKKAEDAAVASAAEARRRYAREVTDALSECSGDPDTCKKQCAASKTSNSCYGLAGLIFRGEGVPKDRTKARELAQATCDAQARTECFLITSFDSFEAKEKAVADAERELPVLFVECAANHRKIAKLKAANDFDGLKALEPSWAQNIEKINAAIEVLTNNEGPRHQELLLRFKRCTEGK